MSSHAGSTSPIAAFESRLGAQLDELRVAGLFREPRTVIPLGSGWCGIDGAKVRNLASNDYLNLASDARLIEAATAVASEEGVGSGASALVSGRGPVHDRLEAKLAEFERTESAVVFPSGYAANMGTLASLVGPNDTVFFDRLNHASLIDGCRLSGATMRVYRRDQLDVLERELKKSSSQSSRWIVTDSVFSMDGLLAPIPDLCDLADKYGALVIVDEAHGTGVFGENGRGVAEATKTESRVAVRIGTLSKAVGCLGGFVAGSRSLVEVLRNSARPQMFSTALPGAVCAAACQALDIVASEDGRRTHLQEMSRLLREELKHFDVPVVEGSLGPIVAVVVGRPDAAISVSKRVLQQGFFVPAIRPPTVPHGTSRVRISLTSAMDESAVRALAVAVTRAFAQESM